MKNIFFLLLLPILFFPLLRIIWQKSDYYLSPFDSRRAEKLYSISQYVREKDASWIADEILFSYAASYYVNGGNPILVNPENPPLGKYIIGVFIKLFNNEKIPSLVFAFFSLYSLYLISQHFLKNKFFALLPVALFSWGKLFQEQIIYVPLLETISLAFLNFAIFFFIKAEKNPRHFCLANIFLGALWATRPWMATIPLVLSWVIYLLLIKKDGKKFRDWLFALPLAVAVLVLCYARLFYDGWGIYKILSIQKWILWYHQSRLIKFGSAWPFIFLNRWFVWWGDKPYLPVNQWTILWPVTVFLSLVGSIPVLFKKLWLKIKILPDLNFGKDIAVLCLWLIFYLAFLSVGNINSRYIFYLIPSCYILSFYFLKNAWR